MPVQVHSLDEKNVKIFMYCLLQIRQYQDQINVIWYTILFIMYIFDTHIIMYIFITDDL